MNFYILTLIISGSNGDWLGRVAPLRIQILSFSCSFRQNNRLGHPLWELVPVPPPENPGSATADLTLFANSSTLYNHGFISVFQLSWRRTTWAPSLPVLSLYCRRATPAIPSHSFTYRNMNSSASETITTGSCANWSRRTLKSMWTIRCVTWVMLKVSG